MPANEKRYFLCNDKCVPYKDLHLYKDAHILGELRYITDEGRRVTALALYKKPVPADEVPPVHPEIMVHIIGDARLIRCDLHDKLLRWEIGKAAFEQLMSRYNRERLVDQVSSDEPTTEGGQAVEVFMKICPPKDKSKLDDEWLEMCGFFVQGWEAHASKKA